METFEQRLHAEIIGLLVPRRVVSLAGAVAGLLALALPAAVLLLTVLLSQAIALLAAVPYLLRGWPLERIRLPSGSPIWLRGRMYPTKGLFDFELLAADVGGLLLWIVAAAGIGIAMAHLHRWFSERRGIMERGNPDASPAIEVAALYVLASPWALLATINSDPTLTCFFLVLHAPISWGVYRLWLWAYRAAVSEFAVYTYLVRARDVMRERTERFHRQG
jgi:hypothetical protein